jgi:hypothetical protein
MLTYITLYPNGYNSAYYACHHLFTQTPFGEILIVSVQVISKLFKAFINILEHICMCPVVYTK